MFREIDRNKFDALFLFFFLVNPTLRLKFLNKKKSKSLLEDVFNNEKGSYFCFITIRNSFFLQIYSK